MVDDNKRINNFMRGFMKNIEIKNIGIITGKLSLNGLRVYLFLINNNLNQFEIEDYANWLGKD